jgi:uncharacterized protein YkwD
MTSTMRRRRASQWCAVLCLMSALGALALYPHAHGAAATRADGAASLTAVERAIVGELNRARTNPAEYAAFIAQLRPYYEGALLKRPGKTPLRTQEGARAADEALQFLRAADPLSPLRPSRGMSAAARDHVADTGPKGLIGHQGSDGSDVGQRLNRYGAWDGQVGENIAYGPTDARDIVLGLIIDDGVPGRGHRQNIFHPSYHVVGVACGAHARFQTMCVITFATEYAEAPTR